MSVRPRYHEIVDRLLDRLRDQTYPAGAALPSETALATEFGVARGTVRHALETIADAEGLVVRRGTRWEARHVPLRQSLDSLRSFGEWARARGMRPGGRIVRLAAGRATTEEARQLQVRPRDRVLRMRRVRELDGRPVMLARTTFPDRFAPLIAALPADTPSFMAALSAQTGTRISHAENLIDAVSADAEDAHALGIRRGTPLLRILRTARTDDGVPFEHSDDRYVPDGVTFSLVNAAPARASA